MLRCPNQTKIILEDLSNHLSIIYFVRSLEENTIRIYGLKCPYNGTRVYLYKAAGGVP